jgi:hypothetical protein
LTSEYECYLQDYAAGEPNVPQLLWEMKATREMFGGAMNNLTKKHRIGEYGEGN